MENYVQLIVSITRGLDGLTKLLTVVTSGVQLFISLLLEFSCTNM